MANAGRRPKNPFLTNATIRATRKKGRPLLPWILLDTAQIPGGGALRLKRRGTEFSIMLGDNELMNSRLGGSEAALAELSAARIENRPAQKILIGGLGMGFTLRAALAAFEFRRPSKSRSLCRPS